MNNTYPCLWLCDIETSMMWYADFLGFKCTYKSSLRNPEFAVIEKENLKLYLIQSDNPDRYASDTVVIETDNIEEAFDSADKSGALVIQSIENGMFGGKDFIVKDYEDNKIISHQSA